MAQGSKEAGAESDNALEAAARRLERALAVLDGRVKELSGRADAGAGGLFDFDRSKLAAELDEARARERELQEAGAEASDALGHAIEDIRKALAGAEEG